MVMAGAMAEAGASVCIAARSVKKNDETEHRIRNQYGVNCMSVTCDVTSEMSVKEAVKQTITRFGKIDILINSAGINIRGPIETLSVADFNQVQQVNVTG